MTSNRSKEKQHSHKGDAGDDAEGQHVPADLLGKVALAAEHEVALDEVQPVRQGPLRQRRQPDLRREETCSSVLDRCLLRRLVDHRRQQAAFTVLQQACEFLQLPLCKPIHLFQHNEVIFHMGNQSIGRIKQLPVEALGIDQVSVLFFQTHRVYGLF